MAWLVQVLIDRKLVCLVHAHGQADGVAAGDVAILKTAIQLVLLLVVAVHQVFRTTAREPAALQNTVCGEDARWRTRRVGGFDVVVDVKGLVGEVTAEGRAGRHIGTGRRLRRCSEIDIVLL